MLMQKLAQNKLLIIAGIVTSIFSVKPAFYFTSSVAVTVQMPYKINMFEV